MIQCLASSLCCQQDLFSLFHTELKPVTKRGPMNRLKYPVDVIQIVVQ